MNRHYIHITENISRLTAFKKLEKSKSNKLIKTNLRFNIQKAR